MEALQTPRVSLGAEQDPAAMDSDKRKRQPRNSACQACASLKMKCVPDVMVPGKCERCNRMGRECTPSIPKARKRRSLGEEPSISTPREVPAVRENVPMQGVSQPPGDRSHKSGEGRAHPTFTHTGGQSCQHMLTQGLGLDDAFGSLLDGIDYNYVQNCFGVYRQLSVHFPFYCLRPDATAASMIADRPLTTAALCTVSSSARPDIQSRLAQAFRRSIAEKAVIHGERSSDLLQGLMVFIAWHHSYMASQQIHRMLYLLAGMASDLGLYRHPYRHDALDLAAVMSQDRAFLGCYYLCSSLSVMGFDRPSPLRWTDNLRRCAENLTMSGNFPQDALMVGIVELVCAVDDLQDALREDGTLALPMHQAYVDMQSKATTHRLKALKRAYPDLASTLGYAAANIHFHHKLLRASDTPDTATLIQVAVAIKEYVDDLLGRPPIILHQVAIVDWTNFLEILILMARVSRPLPNAGGWEAGALSSMLQPEAILDALCAHMAAAPKNDPLTPRSEAQLRWFRGVCGSIKQRVLQERNSGAYPQRNGSSPYDASLGMNGQSVHGRFRPVNEAYASELPLPQHSTQQAPGLFESFNLFGGGLLDPDFWKNFAAG
ncbi:hypothetical protein LTR27_001092 [Elasticomyces elasticus]|nr:hypothetical protein LTR27_001092 [Elasticomyces elasticus]